MAPYVSILCWYGADCSCIRRHASVLKRAGAPLAALNGTDAHRALSNPVRLMFS